ncbi:hypothetical protein BVJ53_12735 [Lacticaseibacillus chiayiensis]|uniref:DUF58 domain-containing protein n=1 Tax=Lacticaseibacillus chiayiensis TaxID=2100821 RepID=A0A4Q1TKF5_9LACO|nr:DUF58 domain-containing protein [Lacticaseibacillus chiayiensis]QVI34732.1 DUF58 domain-containing protein [Lacticaseibacillus chiayiensis]RXT18954.1 hypothetical protein BVJ53_12735 [Lacticaseibacillus chiayiensis]UYN56482.1 DUF58 domain-containing protein [Lacticaseibacillus chiayiensis]
MHWRNFFINSALVVMFGLLVGFGMTFNSSSSWFVSEFALMLLLLLVLPLLWPIRGHLRFRPNHTTMIAERPTTRHLTLTQGRWLPNLFLLDATKTSTWHLLAGQRTAKVTLQLPRGVYDQLPFTVTVTDFFGWFRKTLPLQLTTPITVGPVRQPETAAKIAMDFSQKMAAADAGLPSDRIKNFREYFPGDNIQQIAWKISAHADSLIVHDDEYEGQTAWTLLLVVTPSLPLESALSLFASLLDTGIFSGDGLLLDQRLTWITRGQQDALLAGFHSEGVADPATLSDSASPQHHRAYLVLATDSVTAKPFLQALSPAATALISLSGGGVHA